jgi:hypothetical protein
MPVDKVMKQKWDQGVDWENLLPPSRPSPYHLSIVREALSSLPRHLPVAVLGSTPEFRDLYASLGFERIFILDHSLAFYNRVKPLRCFENDETLVLGDWLLTLRKHPKMFISILSDLTSGNIPYSDRAWFYQSIAEALMPEGIFIDKLLTYETPFISLDTLDEKYRNLPYNLLTLNYFSCEYFFCSELVEVNCITDVDKFYIILDHRFSHPVLKKFLQGSLSITPSGGIWYYGVPWEQLKPEYYRHLRRIAFFKEEPGSPYYERLKVLISQKVS